MKKVRTAISAIIFSFSIPMTLGHTESCYSDRYLVHRVHDIVTQRQIVAGVLEVLPRVLGKLPFPALKLLLAADGIGRALGGKCAGQVGLDDLVEVPYWAVKKGVENYFDGPSREVATNEAKVLPPEGLTPSQIELEAAKAIHGR